VKNGKQISARRKEESLLLTGVCSFPPLRTTTRQAGGCEETFTRLSDQKKLVKRERTSSSMPW
jgi:hypothetical protein